MARARVEAAHTLQLHRLSVAAAADAERAALALAQAQQDRPVVTAAWMTACAARRQRGARLLGSTVQLLQRWQACGAAYAGRWQRQLEARLEEGACVRQCVRVAPP